MSYLLGFQTKYIWNPWGIPDHPAQLVLLYLSTLLDSWLAHCAMWYMKYDDQLAEGEVPSFYVTSYSKRMIGHEFWLINTIIYWFEMNLHEQAKTSMVDDNNIDRKLDFIKILFIYNSCLFIQSGLPTSLHGKSFHWNCVSALRQSSLPCKLFGLFALQAV